MGNDEAAMEAAGSAAQANAEHRPVAIEGEIVTRPASAVTPAIHSLLRHLRDQGLKCVPEPISVEAGVERLRFIDGDSGGDGWFHQHSDEGLASAARLLRSIHDASRDWVVPGDVVWGAPRVQGEDMVFCHGDPGPWNFVWQNGMAVGLLDWDFLHLAPPIDDVAYALQWFAPTRSDEFALEWHHFPAVPDRRHRIEVLLDAYGDLPAFDLVDAVAARMQATSDLVRTLAEQGVEPQRTWVAGGALHQQAIEIAWVRDHRALLT